MRILLGKAWRGAAWPGPAGLGTVGLGMPWRGIAGHGLARPGKVRFGRARLGLVQHSPQTPDGPVAISAAPQPIPAATGAGPSGETPGAGWSAAQVPPAAAAPGHNAPREADR